MANKKFRRMITGILLSCNLISFPFCSAYDVLTETVANQSESEQLKTLYKLGRKIQESEADYQTEVRTIQQDELLNRLNGEIKELTTTKNYYNDLFNGCNAPEKQTALREKFFDTKDIFTTTPNILEAYVNLFMLNSKEMREKQEEFKEDLTKTVYNRLQTYLNQTAYRLICAIAVNSEVSCDRLTEFRLQHPLTVNPDTTSLYKEYDIKRFKNLSDRKQQQHLKTAAERLSELLTPMLEKGLRSQHLRLDIIKWNNLEQPIRELLDNRLLTITTDRDKCEKAIDQLKLVAAKERQSRNQKAVDKAFGTDGGPCVKFPINKTNGHLSMRGVAMAPENLLEAKPELIQGSFSWREMVTLLLRNLTAPATNDHLKLHFSPRGSVERTGYTGYFRTFGSFFEDCENIKQLLNLSLKNTCTVLAGYSTQNSKGQKRYNYVYFIYDYSKYGFVKTGEVYDSKTDSYQSAYAITFVANEQNELITAYPLYM